ncbi:hypothetical protein MNV49_002097 [Pseudohyphozyma bogoriensis]|nr:hypothetical protein MNV49_002097 [Pseudohyphozyma bogoriensis]
MSPAPPAAAAASTSKVEATVEASDSTPLDLEISTFLHGFDVDELTKLEWTAISATPRRPVVAFNCAPLPLELVECILQWTQRGDMLSENPSDLRRFARVSKLWCQAARRILWGQRMIIQNAPSIKRIREAFETSPQLAEYVRKVDLSSPDDRWEPKRVQEFFKRSGAMLRSTEKVEEMFLLHVGLSDPVRKKFFSALQTLKITNFNSDASCWSAPSHTSLSSSDCPDVTALTLTLSRWTHLTTLALHGYSHFPRLISPSLLPLHTSPSYRLKNLDLSGMELESSTLYWLLGRSLSSSSLSDPTPTYSSIEILSIQNVTGLAPDDVRFLLGSLKHSLRDLQLSCDVDDWDQTLPPLGRQLANDTFEGLEKLSSLIFTTDQELPAAMLDSLAALPKLEMVSFNCPSLPALRALSFVNNSGPALKDLGLEVWGEDGSWTCKSRYQLASLCRKRKIDLLIDGTDIECLEDAWHGIGNYGVDLENAWEGLEQLNWVGRGASTGIMRDRRLRR